MFIAGRLCKKSLVSRSKIIIINEALAILFCCEIFHLYVYGKSLKIEIDRKPLKSIFKNAIQSTCLGLQDMIQDSPKEVYVKGSNISIAVILNHKNRRLTI